MIPTDRRLSVGALLTMALAVAALSAPGGEPRPRTAASVEAAEAAVPEPAPTTAAAPTTVTTEPPTAAAFTLASVDLLAVDAGADLPDSARTGVQALLDRYLATAVVKPLRSGQPADDLSAIFAGAALDRMNGPDRAALVDEGLPPAQRLKVDAAEADLTALVGRTGVSLMTAGIRMVVVASVEGVPLRVERTGELLLNADGDEWRVTGYDVRVSRDSTEPMTATTVQR